MANGTPMENSTTEEIYPTTTRFNGSTHTTATNNHLSSSDSSDYTFKASSSPCPLATMTSTPTYKSVTHIQSIINESPELRSSLFSLLQATIAAAEAEQPKLMKDKDAKIEDLQKQLLQASEFGNAKAAEVDRVEASLKLATDTGLEQIEHLEELNAHVKRLEQVEQNLRRGNMALQKAMEGLKEENRKLQRRVKDQEDEIGELVEQCEGQSRSVKLFSHRAKQAEAKSMLLEGEMDKLERENHVLILKGEEMSGKLMTVAEQWHQPVVSSQRKRKGGIEENDEHERPRKISRRF
jgi:chromosome segregation ATPase